MHPKVHQSAVLPYPFFNIISGAKYSGVPQIELASFYFTFKRDKPKSVIFK